MATTGRQSDPAIAASTATTYNYRLSVTKPIAITVGKIGAAVREIHRQTKLTVYSFCPPKNNHVMASIISLASRKLCQYFTLTLDHL